MTPIDFWEVLTFQVSWANSNIFIILLALIVQITVFLFIWRIFVSFFQKVFAIIDKEYSDEELESREQRAIRSIPKIIGLIFIIYLLWYLFFTP